MGQKTYTWLKLKPERDTIDCTIIKAFYGKCRRAGLYSSFLLAVRDPKEKRLYSIGRVSNLPEDTMETLRDIVEQTITRHDDEGVYIKPQLCGGDVSRDSGNGRIHKQLRPESAEDRQIPTRQKHPRN